MKDILGFQILRMKLSASRKVTAIMKDILGFQILLMKLSVSRKVRAISNISQQ